MASAWIGLIFLQWWDDKEHENEHLGYIMVLEQLAITYSRNLTFNHLETF
jgi:hypothetical protein